MRDGRVLIVEDEQSQRSLLETLLKARGYDVDTASGVTEAAQRLEASPPDVVLTDYNMPDGTGLDVLRRARKADPDVGVVLLTAYGTVPMAVEAMREGAIDVLLKPIEAEALFEILGRAMRLRALADENIRLRARLGKTDRAPRIVAESPVMQALLRMTHRVAPTRASVLITGESGTGKELMARLLHERGPAPDGPFVATHCAALSESLLESELFGHAKGAFTGAASDRKGRFEEADGGTLFLDEIGEIPASVQVSLLRVLQEREVVRVGENQTRPVHLRLLAATNRDLEEEVREGRFREDLYYRINVVHLQVPPLRERGEDLPHLIDGFMRECAQREGLVPLAVEAEALQALRAYRFPGNVRELQNLVERSLLLAPGNTIRVEDLPACIGSGSAPGEEREAVGLEAALSVLERRMIREALDQTDGVQTRAAALLGIAERVLRYKMKKHGLSRPGRQAS